MTDAVLKTLVDEIAAGLRLGGIAVVLDVKDHALTAKLDGREFMVGVQEVKK